MRATGVLMAAIVSLVLALPMRADAAPAAPAAAPASPREQWIVQARAADAIGEVLMSAAERAEQQVHLLRRQLAEAGEKAPAENVSASRDAQAAYRALVDRVVAEAGRGGAGEIDPSLANLPDGQLFNEMAALQSYNLRTFRRLDELREQAIALRQRLQAIGKWKGDATTQPAIETPEVLARQALAALKRPQRSPRWAEARRKIRNAIAASQAQQLARPPVPSPLPPPAHGVVVDDPRWQPYYYGPGDPFGGWGEEMYADPFNFRGGGGLYQRHDTRVNAHFDTRTESQPDRRVNVEFDRRLNVHFDPRENF